MVSAAVGTFATLDCFMQPSYLDASLGIRYAMGIIACTITQTFFVVRRQAAQQVFAQLVNVARNLEAMVDTRTFVSDGQCNKKT